MRLGYASLGAVAVFSFFLNLLILTIPLYTLQVFSRVLPSRSEETLWMLTIVAVGALAALGLLDGCRARVLVHLSEWLDRTLREPVLRASVQTSALAHATPDVQGLRDLATLRSFLTGGACIHLFDSPWVPVFVLVIFLVHPLMGAAAALAATLLLGLALANEVATRAALSEANAVAVRQMKGADACVRHAETIEAMGMLPSMIARWSATNDTALALQAQTGRRASTLVALSKFVRLVAQIGALGAGAWLVIHQEITPGAMMAGAIITSRALAPVERLISSWQGFVSARQAHQRLDKLLAPGLRSRQAMRYPTPTGRLTVEGVSFFFPRQTRPALHDISFQLEPGVSLGLIGPSASGKSTLARLLVGVWPARAGTVRLDGIDVFSWERSDSARHVGYLPQDVHLLEGSVKENIARLDQDAPDAMVIEAAKAAHAHELILRLPDGYDTQLGDDGTNLSGGQRQRIALARALYGDPRLLVLDEPSAHLDHEGEAALVDALEAAKARGATVVIIAHKPSILGQTDKMAVLKNGRLEMFGPRPEIMARTTRPAAVPVASVARLATHGEREPG